MSSASTQGNMNTAREKDLLFVPLICQSSAIGLCLYV